MSLKTYTCTICNTKPDQLSHHKTHLETKKHKDKKELFTLKLEKMNESELLRKYYNKNINSIVLEQETYTNNSSAEQTYTIEEEYIKKTIIENSNLISNSDTLRDKIHSIHNFLRNNGAGYGMNALKVFNILYGLKKIEDKGLLDRVNLKRPECEFSYLLKLATDNKKELLCQTILQDVLNSIYKSELNHYIFYEIPKNLKASVFVHLVKEIDKITVIEQSCNVQLAGKIYEYFIGRDETAISELGAYFTHRGIVDFCFNKLDIDIEKDNTIPTMIDPFGGSGGFTTGYINFLKYKYVNNEINWEKEINNIFHYDMNEDVIKSAGLEFFCLTGYLPNKYNMFYKNSFVDEFNNMKFKKIISNPPYGGDKSKDSVTQIKRDKVIKYIKKVLPSITDENIRIARKEQLKRLELEEKEELKNLDKTKITVDNSSDRIRKYAKLHKLGGNDKESSSLILFMDLVDKDGTVLGVLKEGLFFNGVYANLRRHLIENFNVREIISVPNNQFENTTTKTSIIIFDNTETKTTNVKFSELVVEKYTEDRYEDIMGDIVLVESKDDTRSITDILVYEATKDDILKNKTCSFIGTEYNKKEILAAEGYEMLKIGDICEFLPKSKRNASFGQPSGLYNFYTSSDKIQKCNVVDYTKNCILIGTGGNSCIHYTNNFSCSADMLLLTSYKVNMYYIYYMIYSMWSTFTSLMRGSTIKHVTKEMLKEFKIPVPKSQELLNEWVEKISKPYNEKNDIIYNQYILNLYNESIKK